MSDAKLIDAVRSNDLNQVRTLLNNGANPNASGGMTALMYAAQNGHLETAKLLIDKGADVNAKDYGMTALMYAAQNGHLEIANLLIDEGADVNAQERDEGMTALMCAAQNGHLKTAKLLIYKGADVNAQDDDGMTALMYAAQNGHLEIAKLLIDKGADVNAQDRIGMTALMYASKEGNLEVVKTLIENGADYKIKSDEGKTALDLSKDKEFFEAFLLLLSRKHMVDDLMRIVDNKFDPPSIAKFLNLKGIDGEMKFSYSLFSKRFSGMFNFENVESIDVDLTVKSMNLIKQYCYIDSIKNSELSDIIAVCSWMLEKKGHPRRFACLLKNEIIDKINQSDEMPVNYAVDITKLLNETSRTEDGTYQKYDVSESTYLDDLESLFNSDMVGSLTLFLGPGIQVTVEPMILAARSEYFRKQLCNSAWEQKNVIELFDVGLQREEYEQLDSEQKEMRAKALRKILAYWCTCKLDPRIEEALFVLQFCDLFGMEKNELIVEEYLKLFENSNHYDPNLIPEAYRKSNSENKKRSRDAEEKEGNKKPKINEH
jgi:ankyrin repeat protein